MVELDFSTTLYVASTAGTGVSYELRIDNLPTTVGLATVLLRQTSTYVPAALNGIFKNVAPGPHTVSIWGRSVNGDATTVMYDPGCFNSFGVNNVYVKEFL